MASQNYQSFLLRIWQDDPGCAWRASLESISDGVQHNFADVNELLAHIHANYRDTTLNSFSPTSVPDFKEKDE